MNDYLMSLIAALTAQVSNLAAAVNEIQITLAHVTGYLCGTAFSDAVNQTTRKAKTNLLPPPKDVVFGRRDFAKMTESVRIAFQGGHVKAHMRTRKDGLYEVRAQLDRKVYTGAGKTPDEAVERFISHMNDASQHFTKFLEKEEIATQNAPTCGREDVFKTYAKTWLETVKKPHIKETSYREYSLKIDDCLIPAFGEKKMRGISAFDVQDFMNRLTAEGHARTAKQCYAILKMIFDFAETDDAITSSPMRKLSPPSSEQKESKPLSRDEERDLVERFKNNPYNRYLQAFVFLLYTGLRRSELASAVIEDGFVKVVRAKTRAGRKEKTRLIPITPMLEKLLPDIDMKMICAIPVGKLTNRAAACLPGHHAHDLRHTFITRCAECGVRRDIVSVWAGHKLENGNMTDAYTRLETNLELSKTEGRKVDYPL